MPSGQTARRLAGALAIGLAGGACFAWFALPLPWMLGPLAATMAASLAGLRLVIPQRLRQPMFAVVGVMLGGSFTTERLAAAADWLPSLAALPLYVLTIGVVILFYLRRFSGFDSRTAFFAATPGGLGEMVVLADQFGGDLRSVSLIHAARLVLIVACVPFLAGMFGGIQPVAAAAGDQVIELHELLLLAAIGTLGWLLGDRLRLPAASFMGPLFASTAAHLAGWIDHTPPYALLAAAQVVIGAAVGVRFSGVPLRLILRTLMLGVGGALMMFTITFLFGVGLAEITGFGLPLLLIALIPGGFPEMSLIALGMGVDPAFVVTHHCFRVLLVVALAMPIFTLLRRLRWFENHWPEPVPAPSDDKQT